MEKKKVVAIYLFGWLILAALFITYIIMSGATLRTYDCIDGTVVTDKSDCPSCSEDAHCPVDQFCDDGNCTAVECLVDSDCKDINNQCIYNRCRLG
jgi:hypothetical protein